MNQRLRTLLLYALLFLLSVPWYWRLYPELAQRMLLGIPLWVVVSVVGSFCISVQTARVLSRPWPEEETES